MVRVRVMVLVKAKARVLVVVNVVGKVMAVVETRGKLTMIMMRTIPESESWEELKPLSWSWSGRWSSGAWSRSGAWSGES